MKLFIVCSTGIKPDRETSKSKRKTLDSTRPAPDQRSIQIFMRKIVNVGAPIPRLTIAGFVYRQRSFFVLEWHCRLSRIRFLLVGYLNFE